MCYHLTDTRQILWEGVDSLTVLELREACRERGMRAHGMNTVRYQKQLKDWLDLSIQKNVPISLLIMSRAFLITSPIKTDEEVLKSSIGALDEDTINEVVLAVASPKEEDTATMRQRKLESMQFQEEVGMSTNNIISLIMSEFKFDLCYVCDSVDQGRA